MADRTGSATHIREMLERFSDFLDRLAALPYWQLGLMVLILVVSVAGGYFVLRTPSRPPEVFYAAGESEGEGESGSEITVHVSGAVRHPGVVRLPEGARVIDAVEGAGGPLPEADLEALNLAQVIQDGQKVAVPRVGEAERGGDDGGGGAGKKVNLNTATRQELESLPGIGSTLAERIIAYRQKAGSFRSVDELKKISGIGEKKFQEIKDLVDI